MATTTLTIPGDASDVGADAEKYARIVNIIRNMTDCKRSEDNKVVVPVRTISNPSPPKKTASNRHPGQTHTRTEVDDALAHELAMARYLMHDLADHVLGHIVSTKLAGDILLDFVERGFIQVYEGAGARNKHVSPLLSKSEKAQRAVQQAFEDADYYDCIQPDTERDGGESASSTDGRGKGKGKKKAELYTFKWTTFPVEPLGEDDLVSFLNDITDRAFVVAKPELAVANPKLRHRFAAPKDKHHAIPLSYEADGEDMRPDFLLLPIEAFSDDFKTVDQKYVNFTAARLVGESKNKDLAAGVEQMQRYARGLKRAQPWVYYVLGMTITKDKAVFSRGEGSGTERLELMLTDGRGCIEFIRILLGLALADKVDLGHNPDVILERRKQACKVRNVTRRSNTAKSTSQRPGKDDVFSVPNLPSRFAISQTESAVRHCSDSAAFRPHATSSKRVYSEITDDGNEGTKPKKLKTNQGVVDEVDRYVFFPIAVYGHECVGILFTASSIRGRGTTVFCVVDFEDSEKRLALKMAWQDVGRVAEQDAVAERLKNKSHPNLVVPFETFKVERDGKTCTTLGVIRGFLDDQVEKLRIENRVLTISVSELKRPVKYFWGVHDFVRGLRGALLGHEYLTKIGILHRDISENNIVLGLRPEDERGYLIDLDMAILQNAEEPTPAAPASYRISARKQAKQRSSAPYTLDDKKSQHMKGLRTGTFPYMSYNVLYGGRHTQFDDVESFLYVLLLFFFSYAGPLSEMELYQADRNGFVQSIGSGRPSHMRNWPRKYADWADGNIIDIAEKKSNTFLNLHGITRLIESPELVDCLDNNWPGELHDAIYELIDESFILFATSAISIAAKVSRTEVSHAAFVDVLDKWLDTYSDLEDKFSNCPFKQVMHEN